MHLRIDTRVVPPAVDVVDAEDFTAFKVVLVTDSHAWVEPGALAELAGRTADPEWQQKLTGMLAYAQSKGWCDEDGRIRAHVEVQTT
ncbi:hypothetical protein [Mycolicibacterium bacteremicum]|uniref:hypothetical protein n=1 Tax=Mycolicibacterium bacteremicum TaxID=564198 RepID=UPI0026EED02E|nr:hypothetical protein [Mycolicibacterium bacteremicum]